MEKGLIDSCGAYAVFHTEDDAYPFEVVCGTTDDDGVFVKKVEVLGAFATYAHATLFAQEISKRS